MRTPARKHITRTNLIGSLIGTVFVFFMLSPAILAWSHLYERFSSNETWFIYHNVVPTKPAFSIGEHPSFNSFITYHKELRMHWEDTLFCNTENGLRKLRTQRWPLVGTEFKSPGFVNIGLAENEDLSYWTYAVVDVPQEASACFMQGVAIGETPLGYEKNMLYTTELFEVNKIYEEQSQ